MILKVSSPVRTFAVNHTNYTDLLFRLGQFLPEIAPTDDTATCEPALGSASRAENQLQTAPFEPQATSSPIEPGSEASLWPHNYSLRTR
jgi:hypothetical protein